MLGVSKSDYQHAQLVWEEFGIRNIGDYHDLYLRTDVLLLSGTLRPGSRMHIQMSWKNANICSESLSLVQSQ